MSNLTDTTKPEPEPEAGAKDGVSTWDEVRRLADELELKIHLAGMNARDRWRTLEPRIATLEKWFERTGEKAGEAITKELSAIAALLRKLRADIANGDMH